MLLQQEISRDMNRLMIGKTLQVLIEKRSDKVPRQWIGRSYRDAPDIDGNVMIGTLKTLKPGSFYPVRITGSQDYDLMGQI